MAAVERGDVRARAPVAVHDAAGPAAVRAAEPGRPGADGRRRARPPAARRPGAVRARHRPRMDRALDGAGAVARGVGPDAARQVRRARGRDRDGVAVEQAPAAARGGRARGAARLPGRLVGAAVRGAARPHRRARRARADRPPGGADRAGPRGHLRRARLVPGRPRPARLRAGRRRAVRPRARHRPERRLRPAHRPSGAADRVLRRALPAARARPPVHALLLDQRRRPRAAVRGADRAHQLRRAGALRRPPLPVRRQLPRARARAAGARRRRPARPLPARPRAREPGLRPLLGGQPLAAPRARRAADRHRRVPGAHTAAEDVHPGPRARQHDPGLSRGPRHQLRGPARRTRRAERRMGE